MMYVRRNEEVYEELSHFTDTQFLSDPGREDVVVRNEKRLLEEHGHKVYTYYRSNSELAKKGIVGKLFLPFTAVFSLKTYREVKS